MAKLTLLPLLAILLLVAHTGCAYRWGKPSCSQKLQQLNLQACEKHISERIQYQPEEEEADEDHNLRLRGSKFWTVRRNKSNDNERECCNELQELYFSRPRCQCPALQSIMENFECERHQRKDLERELTFLPERCGFGPPALICDLQCQNN